MDPPRQVVLGTVHVFFPMVWFMTILLTMTDKAVQMLVSNQTPITFGKLIRHLGMRLLIAMSPGWSIDQFWDYTDSSTPQNQEANPYPYNFKVFMLAC
jgi:hypothetical protein